jgi:hypothetical protein
VAWKGNAEAYGKLIVIKKTRTEKKEKKIFLIS